MPTTEREALDLIRATATRSVPNCINLQAIDRILADVGPAPAPAVGAATGSQAEAEPDYSDPAVQRKMDLEAATRLCLRGYLGAGRRDEIRRRIERKYQSAIDSHA